MLSAFSGRSEVPRECVHTNSMQKRVTVSDRCCVPSTVLPAVRQLRSVEEHYANRVTELERLRQAKEALELDKANLARDVELCAWMRRDSFILSKMKESISDCRRSL